MTSTHHITHRLGTLGGFLLLIQVLGLLLGEVHFAVVAHSVCAEHGEVVHESVTHADGHKALGSVAEARINGERALSPEPVPGEHAHDHCMLTLTGDDTDAAASAWSVVGITSFALSMQPLEPVFWEAVPRAETQAYLFAPKNSPPVRV